MGKAIHHYGLIEDGDEIAVAVSGGKDSMVLLRLLRDRQRRVPIRYGITAIHVDLGFDDEPAARLEDFFRKEGFSYEIIRTDYGITAHSSENRENPCFLCSRLRRSALFTRAHELNCRKIAFGHNQDDFIETFFLNICYSGQVSTMLPRQPFFNGEITAIRPLALAPSARIEKLCQRLGLPVVSNPCPSACNSRRRDIRALLQSLYGTNHKVRGNIFHAMSNVNSEYLPPPLRPRTAAPSPAHELEIDRDGRKTDSLPD